MEVVHVLVTSILNKLESLNVTALITLETRKMHKYTCKVQNLNFTNYSFKAGCVFFTMESYRNCVDFTLERKPTCFNNYKRHMVFHNSNLGLSYLSRYKILLSFIYIFFLNR